VQLTRFRPPAWSGSPPGKSEKARASALKLDYARQFNEFAAVQARAARVTLQEELKRLDTDRTLALWTFVRRELDYPIFFASPRAVGITSTGETGESVPNALPDVLLAYRSFKQ
jgi:type I restriction enzyme M protein